MKVLWVHNFDPAVENSGVFLQPHAAALRARGVTVDLFYTGNLRSWRGVLRARAQLSEQAGTYDVVHSQYGSACALVTIAADRPKIVTLRGSDWHRFPKPTSSLWLHSILANRFSRMALPHFNAVVTVSARIRSEVLRGGYGGPVAVVPSPIDLELFQRRDRMETRRQVFDDRSEAPWLLFTSLSSTNPIKRVALARAIVDRVRREIPSAQLRVASGLKHADMPHFVSACDVVLCTSVYEGWPNSVKEGLACGLPFVATDVSDLAALAGSNPPCFVGDADPDVLGAAVLRALEVGGGAHLRRSVASMTPDHGADALLELYRQLV